MSQWSGHARSNYFQVKDAAAFQAEFAKYEVKIETNKDGAVALFSVEEFGGWPTNVLNETTDDWDDIDIPRLVADHLADDEVAVFQEIGNEKMGYLTGSARAINNKFKEVVINIDSIYTQAEHLGANMTLVSD
ncbi:MAG: hypothetical protein ACOH1Y_17910 [Propionicimonas sp.]